MQNTIIARTFAEAFYDIICDSKDKKDLLDQLSFLVKCIDEQHDFHTFLITPKVSYVAKKDFIEKVFRGKLHDTLVDFLQVLTNKGHLSAICDIYREVESLQELEGSKVKVFVTTATSLLEDAKSKIKKTLEKKLSAEVVLVEQVNADIIGGFIVRVEDTLVNGSIKHHLEKIGNCILERSKTYGI
ncbi:ATP synthase F1 subunit delta [Candidatus Uabimicrobium sp. HlEnr_7]|uniref:ATP synthase F1 subunit delta n=1 Tax=Candidatus Uabimicrobium helgolandensis TaxID=3095367 RepID=UPI00355897F5